MLIRTIVSCLLLAVVLGCGGEPQTPADAPSTVAVPPPAPAQVPAPADAAPAAVATPVPPPAAVDEPPQPPGKAAEAGVGRRGQDIKGDGYLPTVVRAIPRTEERITFLNVKRALDLYKAGHDGRGPATHEEYMEKIIKENQIKLPELPAGRKYLYDPPSEELRVVYEK